MIDFPDTHQCIATEARVCEQHGSYSARQLELIRKPKGYPKIGPAGLHQFLQPFWTRCPTCDGQIQLEVDARDQEIKGGMSRKEAARAAARREAGIPDRFKDCTVWSWRHTFDQQRRVHEAVKGYVSQFDVALQSGRSVLMIGSSGTGKTHLACGILRHVSDSGGTGFYTTAVDLVGTIRATYGKNAQDTEQKVIDRLCAVDLLVIDEVGRQNDTAYEKEQVWRVLDKRYANRKPAVVVTNLGIDAFTKWMGQAMVDRLREGGGVVCMFDWPSQRSPKPGREADDAR